jgi:isopentenyl-diphosphate delta-isomerase
MTEVVLVDESDKQLGTMGELEAHLGKGHLHRAFTVFVFNTKDETLLAQRSSTKMLWPLIWDSACASHPQENEDYKMSGERRLNEELGFSCPLVVADRFQYQAKFGNVGSEKEICMTLIGKYDGEVHPNPDEVAEYKWSSVADLKDNIDKKTDKYTIWLKIALDRLVSQGKIR